MVNANVPYYDDAAGFFLKYDGTGTKKFVGIGKDSLEPGWVIRQSNGKGGIFTGANHPLGEGIPVSLWYK